MRPEDGLVKRLKHEVFNHNKYSVTACDASTVGRSFLLCQLTWLAAQSWRSGSQQYYVSTESSDRVSRPGKPPLNFRWRQWLFCSPLHQNMLRNRPNLLVYGHRHIIPAHKAAGIRTPVIEIRSAWSYLSTSSPPWIFSTCSLINRLNPSGNYMDQLLWNATKYIDYVPPTKLTIFIFEMDCVLWEEWINFFFFYRRLVAGPSPWRLGFQPWPSTWDLLRIKWQ